MTIQETECCLCASILDEPTSKLSPSVCTALACSDLWESPEAIKVADGIRKCIEHDKPTHRIPVGLFMELNFREWLKHPLFNQGLPMSCLDCLIEPLLRHYRNKRIVSYVADTYERLTRDTAKAQEIAIKLKEQLEELCK